MNSKDTQDEGSEPHDHGQEGEGLSRTPLSTHVAATKGEPSPTPCTAAVGTVEPRDEQTEYGSPATSEHCCIISEWCKVDKWYAYQDQRRSRSWKK